MVEQTNPALEKTDELAGEEGRSDPLTGASKPGIL